MSVSPSRAGWLTYHSCPGDATSEIRHLTQARDFQAMVERSGESQQIREALLKQVKQLFKWWHWARDGDLARERLEVALIF